MKAKKYTLTQTDLKKIAMGAAVALGGAALTYLSEVVIDTDFGVYTALVVALASVAINAARKWLEGRPA